MSAEAAAAFPGPLDDPELVRHGLTRAQFDRLVAAGEFEGQHVELLEGALVEMTPQGGPHRRAVVSLANRLVRQLPDDLFVAPQVPMATAADSEPEPDVYVIDAAANDSDDHPSWAHVVIEVAVTSQRTDLLHKSRIYARAGIPQYWVVDLPGDRVVVHTDPQGDAYASVDARPLDTPLEIRGMPIVLADLLR